MKNLLKIKSIVTILMTLTLVYVVVAKVEVPADVMSLFTASFGAVIASLFAKKDAATTE